MTIPTKKKLITLFSVLTIWLMAAIILIQSKVIESKPEQVTVIRQVDTRRTVYLPVEMPPKVIIKKIYVHPRHKRIAHKAMKKQACPAGYELARNSLCYEKKTKQLLIF